jgi:threonine dehydratase
MCRELVDGVVLVPTDATCAAIKDVFEDTRSILEPAGALAVAGAKASRAHHNLKGKKLRSHSHDSWC